MSRNLAPEKVDRIARLLLLGESIRNIAAVVCASKVTVSRHKRILLSRVDGTIRCACGKCAGHRGWCRERVKTSPARQEFLASWGRPAAPMILTKAPRPSGEALILAIRALLPRSLPPDLGGDVENDIALAVLSGEIHQSEIARKVNEFVTRARRVLPNPWRDISIDAPLNEDGATLADFLAAPDECFDSTEAE